MNVFLCLKTWTVSGIESLSPLGPLGHELWRTDTRHPPTADTSIGIQKISSVAPEGAEISRAKVKKNPLLRACFEDRVEFIELLDTLFISQEYIQYTYTYRSTLYIVCCFDANAMPN